MKNGWYTALVVGALMVGCATEGADFETGSKADVGGKPEQVEDAGNTTPPDVAGEEKDMGEGDVHIEEEQHEEEEENEEHEEQDTWEIGDPASGTGPFWPGTGRRQFEPLVHGDDVRWERGIQGGHHIWISAELERPFSEALEEDERQQIRHTYRFIHEDGELLAQASRTGGFRFNEEFEKWRALGLYAVLEAPRRPSTMDDDLIRYVLDVEMEDGQKFQREIWLVSQCCD